VKLESWKRAERRQVRAELRQLAKEERQRQQKALQVSLLEIDIVVEFNLKLHVGRLPSKMACTTHHAHYLVGGAGERSPSAMPSTNLSAHAVISPGTRLAILRVPHACQRLLAGTER
jgi:hypothetical protein